MGIIGTQKKFFIAGTDTGVGKTYVACQIIRYLADQGEEVGIFKPIETGITSEERSDAFLLRKAAHSDAPIALISPYRFKSSAAPRVASLKEKREINIRKILTLFTKIALNHDWVIVEGAGGLLVPIRRKFLMADLILSLQLPMILVSCNRLGTINHTLLSIDFARKHGIDILAVILNQKEKESGFSSIRANKRMIEENCNIPVLPYQISMTNYSKKLFWKRLLD